jgi:pterin-4a-carbinolamine dehydratase
MARTPMTVKRGAIPSPRARLAAATPHKALPAVPSNHLFVPKKLSIWHNDMHGDCVTAEEAFAKACHKPEIFISDTEVEIWAKAHGVYEGANLIDVLDAMQKKGFSQDDHTFDDGAPTSVDWTSEPILQSALYHGPVKIGVAANQLETTCQSTNFKSGWFATGYVADPAEDHCVSLAGYGSISWLAQQMKFTVPAGINGSKPGYAMFTWGSIGIIDVPSMLAVTHEAWLRTPTTVVI